MSGNIRLKTKEDIALLREGGKRHAEIMRRLVTFVRPGMEIKEFDDVLPGIIEEVDRARGTKPFGDQSALLGYHPSGAPRSYPANICVSVNDEVVHGIPNENNRTIKEGDIVSLDFALVHRNMITDMAVTVAVGEVSPEISALLETTKQALMAGIKAAKGGARVGDISMAVERVGKGANGGKGYGIVEELVGHGVGYDVHEPPYVPNYTSGAGLGKKEKAGRGAKNKGILGEVLQPGAVVAIEPMFNLGTKHVTIDEDGYTIRTEDGLPSAHFEHTVLITKGNAEILTS
jgi:methionyl aminopeptidase